MVWAFRKIMVSHQILGHFHRYHDLESKWNQLEHPGAIDERLPIYSQDLLDY